MITRFISKEKQRNYKSYKIRITVAYRNRCALGTEQVASSSPGRVYLNTAHAQFNQQLDQASCPQIAQHVAPKES